MLEEIIALAKTSREGLINYIQNYVLAQNEQGQWVRREGVTDEIVAKAKDALDNFNETCKRAIEGNQALINKQNVLKEKRNALRDSIKESGLKSFAKIPLYRDYLGL